MPNQTAAPPLDSTHLSPLELVQQITPMLLKGTYTYVSIWRDLIKLHQKSQWSLTDSSSIQKILQDTIEQCNEGVQLKNSDAITMRAFLHHNGIDGVVNFYEAINLYEQEIKLGNAIAMNDRAYMHQNGQGGPVDFPAAIKLYEQAIKLGDSCAMFNRGWMHQKGQGGPVDFPAAIKLYEQAIKLGNSCAMHNRGLMHQNGQGGMKDEIKAARLFRRAANINNIEAGESLKNLAQSSRTPIVQYHYAMHKKCLEQALNLLLKENDVLFKLLEWDNSTYSFVHDESLKELIQLIELEVPPDSQEELTRIICALDKKVNEAHTRFLFAPYIKINNRLAEDFQTLIEIKIRYFSKLDIKKVEKHHIIPLIESLASSWMDVHNFEYNPELTHFTANALGELLHRLILIPSIGCPEPILRRCALIFIKALYGNAYDIKMESLTIDKLMFLVNAYEVQIDLPTDDMHALLELKFICTQKMPVNGLSIFSPFTSPPLQSNQDLGAQNDSKSKII